MWLVYLAINHLVLLGAARAQVAPKPKGPAMVVANVTDPELNRDSCGSVKIGDRVLWVCRDTTGFDAQSDEAKGSIVPNSASWTNLNASGGPVIVDDAPTGPGSNGSNPVLLMYGGSYNSTDTLPFYPLASDECPMRGICSNGSARFAVWPGQPPMISKTNSQTGAVIGYSWISKNEIAGHGNLSELYPNQPFSLYRFDYTPPTTNEDPAPVPVIVAEDFWAQNAWGYGANGNLVQNGTAYLYAQNDNRTEVALAKVAVDDIEDQTQYSYYVNGNWTTEMPSLTDSDAFIPNLGANHQGTFYYSKAFGSYIWIGYYPSINSTKGMIDFVMTTAPAPEGPWITPYYLFSEPKGSGELGAYSIQAHTSLIPDAETSRSIYLTYTMQNSFDYVTPLIYVEFE